MNPEKEAMDIMIGRLRIKSERIAKMRVAMSWITPPAVGIIFYFPVRVCVRIQFEAWDS